MATIVFLISGVLYGLYAWLCFNPALKSLSWTKSVGLLTAVLANILWIFLAHNTTDPSKLLFYAMVWDAIVTLSSILVPVFCFGSTLTTLGWTGLGTVVMGLFLMKLGFH